MSSPSVLGRVRLGPRSIPVSIRIGALGAARSSRFALPLLLTCLVTGCAANFSPSLQIDPVPQALHTNQTVRLTASVAGEPTTAAWRVTSSDNAAALGSGSVTRQGLYTTPSTLSRDLVTVTLSASTPAGETQTALTLIPAFAQPLQPENATLTPGATIQLRAQLAEVDAGTVLWELASPQNGTLADQNCTRSRTQFTTCTASYTAPQTLPPGTRITVIATGPGTPGATAQARLLIGPVNSNPVLHQQEQRAPIALGASGSNDSDFDTLPPTQNSPNRVADCCGGTLGALVEDPVTGTPYLLSNNHVLATSDQGRPGDVIEHPGLIDDACVPLTSPGAQMRPIGRLRSTVPLDGATVGSRKPGNVDAALASLAPGAIDLSGAILELGSPTTSPERTLGAAPPTAGRGEPLTAPLLDRLRVVKSGRTTGLTCSTVEAVDLSVQVDYYKDCAETQPYTTRTFTGQIAVGGEAFADSGDSGALLLDAENAEGIGLLYATASTSDATPPDRAAGSGGLTLANPIADVLAELGAQLHPETPTPLLLRGSAALHELTCLNYDPSGIAPRPPAAALAPDERARALAAVEAASGLLAARPRTILAAAPGSSADSPGEGAVLLYVDRTAKGSALPAILRGVRTVPVLTDAATISRGEPAGWPLPSTQPGIHLAAQALAAARSVVDRRAPQLLAIPGVFGAGVAQSLDSPEEASILLLIDPDSISLAAVAALEHLTGTPADTAPTLPTTLDGLRIRYLRMRRFHVTRSKYLTAAGPSACKLPGLH